MRSYDSTLPTTNWTVTDQNVLQTPGNLAVRPNGNTLVADTFLTGAGKVKHDGTEYDITTNANVLGAAQYKVKQSLEIPDATTLRAANNVYEIQNTTRNGMLFGIGILRYFCIRYIYSAFRSLFIFWKNLK